METVFVRNARLVNALVGVLSISCASANPHEDFAAFRRVAFEEPETGLLITDGDTPSRSEAELRALFERQREARRSSTGGIADLAVGTSAGVDLRWQDDAKRRLSFCVSTKFGGKHSAVVEAILAAAADWSSAADVDFQYHAEHDEHCDVTAPVMFDVRPVCHGAYIARSFFPGYERALRSLLVDDAALKASNNLAGTMLHELGHILGFRHEHTRAESGLCFEDDDVRALTPFDPLSVMMYPECGGRNIALRLSELDRQGASLAYGPAIR